MKPALTMLGAITTALALPRFFASHSIFGSDLNAPNVASALVTSSSCAGAALAAVLPIAAAKTNAGNMQASLKIRRCIFLSFDLIIQA
jgi:hypothetical protein